MHRLLTAVVLAVAALSTACETRRPTDASSSRAPTTRPTTQPLVIQIDLDQAMRISIPENQEELKPVIFKTADNREGWAIRIPGDRPIATPCFAEGLLFVGGGYGSNEFYAFKADTGELAWQVHTNDDGPTAAVYESGLVAFNTESCTICVLEARTGKLVWREWLGDPLMSQPAITNGRLFMAYPGGNPRGVQRGDHEPQKPAQVGPAKGDGHRLLCADLGTGQHIWEQDISGEIISAPVIEGNQVLLTCFDGVMFCLDANNGQTIWKKDNGATSAPLVADGQLVVSEKLVVAGKAKEGIRIRSLARNEAVSPEPAAQRSAAYLERGHEGSTAIPTTQAVAMDTSVGFGMGGMGMGGGYGGYGGGYGGYGGGLPGSPSTKPVDHLNVTSVVAGWAYQGSRAAVSGGRIINAQGNTVNNLDFNSGAVNWEATARGQDVSAERQMFSPPSLGKENIYIASATGHLVSLSQKDGKLRFLYDTKRPMAFQPALAKGNLYVGTIDGTLICLKTGSSDADGWHAWGGNAQHNKKQ